MRFRILNTANNCNFHFKEQNSFKHQLEFLFVQCMNCTGIPVPVPYLQYRYIQIVRYLGNLVEVIFDRFSSKLTIFERVIRFLETFFQVIKSNRKNTLDVYFDQLCGPVLNSFRSGSQAFVNSDLNPTIIIRDSVTRK